MKLIFTLVLLSFFNICSSVCFAQADTHYFKVGKYNFRGVHVDTNYSTTLRITDGNDVIFKGEFEETIDTVFQIDMNKDGSKTIFMNTYTGGAHCCNILYACKIKNDKFTITDTLFLADSYFDILDLDRNGKFQLRAYNMMFAYAFTNFAETRAPEVVYSFANGRFKNVTKNYPALLEAQIDEWSTDLKAILDGAFKCEPDGEETFNTDAGSVKTLLAAITANYYTMGEVYKGYDLINESYTCPDKEAFVKILQEDYKLK